jgi:20S proteasome subunit alpha 2
VLATEKKASSPLVEPHSSSKIALITPNIGMVYAGMGPDYRVLVDKARKVSHTDYKRVYNEYPPTRILVQDVARVMQGATQQGGVRPFGVSLLIAGWDDGVEPEQPEPKAGEQPEAEKKATRGKTGGILKGGPSLYQVDPSGSYFPWKATAIGKGSTSAKTFLEKRYTEELELEDAIHIALLTLKETIEGEMNGDTVEIGKCARVVAALLTAQASSDRPRMGCSGTRGLRALRDRDSGSSARKRSRITLPAFSHLHVESWKIHRSKPKTCERSVTFQPLYAFRQSRCPLMITSSVMLKDTEISELRIQK